MKKAIGLLGWLGVALVVAAVILRFTRPQHPELYQRLALAGLAVTIIYALSQWREIGRTFQGRQAQYGSVAAGSVIMFLAILVGVNYVSNRQNKRWDLTETKQFTLSDQTKQIITTLKGPLAIKVFYAPDQQTGQSPVGGYRDQLERYQYLSSQVSIDYIDAQATPIEAEKNGITRVPTVVLEYGGRTQQTNSLDEEALTNSLKKVIEGKAKKAYFTEGHGERESSDTSSRQGFAGIASALTGDNFETAKLQIAQKGSIPADATVVVIAGPVSDFLPQETDLVRGFLKSGGKVMLMIDPPSAKGTPDPLTNLVALAREWGIQIGNDVVVDQNGVVNFNDFMIPVGMPMDHAITANTRKTAAAFPVARSVMPVSGGVDGRTAQTFVQSGEVSWAEADLKALFANGQPKKELDKGDKNGPVSLAAAVSSPASGAAPAPGGQPAESRFVVFGDSDFATNQAINLGGNKNLFLNAMNWLALQENLISIRPKDPQDRRLQLTADQTKGVMWFVLAVVPLALFGNAFRLYWKRR